MNKEIAFFALGGIGENGKNFYLLQIKSAYFILDAGIKYPDVSSHGIDYVLPEYTCLDDIKHQIKGIFITSALDTHSGALPYLIQYLNIPVYASFFVTEVLKANLAQHSEIDCKKIIFKTVYEKTQLKFDELQISFFGISHFLPDTLGMVFTTSHGTILYLGEMPFSQNKKKNFQTNFSFLNQLTHQKTLALVTSTQGAFHVTKADQEKLLEYNLSSYFANIENNIIISFLIPDLLKIQLVIDLAVENQLKIAILGRKSENILDVALKKGYLRVPENFLVNLKTSQDYLKYPNLVVIIVGKRFEPFYRLQRMLKQTDRLMKLDPKDKILLFSAETIGVDQVQHKTLDMLIRQDFKVDILIDNLLATSSLHEENFKLILHLTNPQFILPVIGEYRHQYKMKQIALNFNYTEKDIFIFENGDKWIYDYPNRPYVYKNFLSHLGEILIDGTPVFEGNNYILKDRELLSKDGVFLIACNIDLKKRCIIGNIEAVSKGFTNPNQAGPILTKAQDMFIHLIEKFLSQNNEIKWNDFKNYLKEELTKFLFKEIKKKPVIIPVLIVVNH